jgi:1-deoxy-D-xylulose-5-phosphate reductoisomerase
VSETRRLVILGSTGSIGTNALQVVRENPGRFEVTGLAAGRNARLLADQIREFRPARVAVASVDAARGLREMLGSGAPRVDAGEEAVRDLAGAGDADVVVAAMVGAAGICPALAALEAGRDVALANKEALVVAGELMTEAARRRGGRILPVDSEHNALHQCLRSGKPGEVRRVILTASGGPFRERPLATFSSIGIDEALRHPTWKMGRKVTVDSATLMNKGLELIEARWLFSLAPEQIDVLIHPQSVVHSLVEFVDGAQIAQLATPDMGLPIQYALSYPDRWPTLRRRLELSEAGRLEFSLPDPRRYPCLGIAREALRRGGSWPAALNAADEVAVEEFLAGRLAFTGIPRVLSEVMDGWQGGPASELGALLAADAEARRRARAAAERGAGSA